MTRRSSNDIIQNLTTQLRNNNAGEISAADVRDNMIDIVDSIIPIVTTELDNNDPFKNNILVGDPADGVNTKLLSVASGILFRDGSEQNVAYPGPGGIDHGDLTGLSDDDHPIYFNLDGTKPITGNVAISGQWINSNRTNNRGLRFDEVQSGDEVITVASNTSVKFAYDNSTISTAKGDARAWLNFSASGAADPVTVNSQYNIAGIQRLNSSEGKFKITFPVGTFSDTSFVAFGSSNGRTTADSADDFSINTVGIADRGGVGSTLNPHYLTFYVLSSDTLTDSAQNSPGYVDAPINDLVVYGAASGVTSEDVSNVTIIN